jgi:hypothetical protein
MKQFNREVYHSLHSLQRVECVEFCLRSSIDLCDVAIRYRDIPTSSSCYPISVYLLYIAVTFRIFCLRLLLFVIYLRLKQYYTALLCVL